LFRSVGRSIAHRESTPSPFGTVSTSTPRYRPGILMPTG
jgi:hypothetical protein